MFHAYISIQKLHHVATEKPLFCSSSEASLIVAPNERALRAFRIPDETFWQKFNSMHCMVISHTGFSGTVKANCLNYCARNFGGRMVSSTCKWHPRRVDELNELLILPYLEAGVRDT